MDQVEEMAVREPLNALTLLLDTVQKDDQLREEFAIVSFGGVPKVRLMGLWKYKEINNILRLQTRSGTSEEDIASLRLSRTITVSLIKMVNTGKRRLFS